MFARTFVRCANAAPLKQGIRSYASQASSNGSGFARAGAGAAAVVGAAAGVYMYSAQQQSPARLDSPAAEAKAFQGGEQGFISLKLADVKELSHNTKWLRFHLPEDEMTSGLPVTSAVVTKYKGPEMEKPVIRPYTPTSPVDQKGFVDFVIKKYEGGPMSSHLHDLIPGQRLDIKGPIPKYPWEANKHEHIALIAGGTGITPMWQLAQHIMKDPQDKTKITLVFGNVTENDILLKHELAELENTYPRRFKAFYTLDKPSEDWPAGKGHITEELLKQVLPEPSSGNVKVFVCGPPGLYKAISGTKKSPQDQGELDGYLKKLGYSKDQVFKF